MCASFPACFHGHAEGRGTRSFFSQWALLCAVVGGVGAMTGCGNDQLRAGGPGAGAMADTENAAEAIGEACKTFATQLCDRREECAQARSTSFNRRACELERQEACAEEVDHEGSSLTSASLSDCATLVADLDCRRLLQRFDGIQWTSREGRMRSTRGCIESAGELNLGQPCLKDHQCASGLCLVNSEERCGTCSPLEESRAQYENRGLRIWEYNTALEAAGTPPALEDKCLNDYLILEDGVCKKPTGMEGDPCGETTECDHFHSLQCADQDGDALDADTDGDNPVRVCQTAVIVEIGESCERIGVIPPHLCDENVSFCGNQNDLGEGYCLAYRHLGEPCENYRGKCSPELICMAPDGKELGETEYRVGTCMPWVPRAPARIDCQGS